MKEYILVRYSHMELIALMLKKMYGINYTIFLFGEEVSKVILKSIKYKIFIFL